MLRDLRAAALRLGRQCRAGFASLAARPRSLERLLLFTIAGLVLFSIVVIALTAVGLLREQASEQALTRVRGAALAARYDIRRVAEDTATAARLLASRPTLLRLTGAGDALQLQLFLKRFCDTARLDGCTVYRDTVPVASSGETLAWDVASTASREQGESFMIASRERGPMGALVEVAGLPGTHVLATRRLDEKLAAELSSEAGVEIRLLPVTAWLESVDPAYRDVHSIALAAGDIAVAPIPAKGGFAASLPVFASTGEAVLLIEARLPAEQAAGAVGSFVRRLVVITLLLAGAALIASLLLARRIGTPLQALATSAERLGQGDFSSSIPAQGTQEVEALARTMEDMRRNLMDLTATLRQREAEAQAVLDGIVEGVYAVDFERRIRYLNPQAARMLGAPASELIGKFCGDVLKPRDVDGRRPCDFMCPIYAARDEGKAEVTHHLQAGGVPRTVVVTSAAPTAGLQVQVMRDETELEAVRRARDSVLANISHEFRTPLSAQLASVELMLDGLDTMPRERLGELLESLQRGTLRLTRLIDNLLESVRIESGQLGIRRHPVAMAQVVEDAQDLVAGLLVQRQQTLRIALPADLPTITGDGPRLTQVVTNLLANANKYAPEGSEITVGAARHGDGIELWVEDTGPGAPELEGPSIFERFYRAADQEPDPKGLGLGLWIVKSIVQRHGGNVRAERTAANHTRFTVTLPGKPA
ncbi:MAG TPA: ATP-binding protein [Steroidobacteraceae bacterium]|nr:ATP-binding protein [Steroidobacteraceae bacterium]